jgi:hypothetical protein
MIGTIALGALTLIAVSSYKYLPGSYSIRFFWCIAKYIYIKPINKNPISPFTELIRYNNCCLLECDFFGFHKNNVTYFTELDICRTETTLNALHYYFKNCYLTGKKIAFVPLASIQNHFMKEIKPFQNYEMHTKIVSWGNKWFWLITIFTINEKIKEIINPINENDLNLNVPENLPPLYLNYKNGDKFGKRVCCLSLGKLVFKDGRKTLPPWEAIKLANINNNEFNLKAIENEKKIALFSNNPTELLQIYENTI